MRKTLTMLGFASLLFGGCEVLVPTQPEPQPPPQPCPAGYNFISSLAAQTACSEDNTVDLAADGVFVGLEAGNEVVCVARLDQLWICEAPDCNDGYSLFWNPQNRPLCITDCQPGQERHFNESGMPDCVEPRPEACDEVDCSGVGRCRNNNGQPVCECNEGYVADGLQCIVPNEPQPVPQPEPEPEIATCQPERAEWDRLDNAPIERSRAAIAAVDDLVIQFFGQSDHGLVSSVAIRDDGAGTWHLVAGPTGLPGMYNASVAVVENEIYLFGPDTDLDARSPTNIFLKFSVRDWRRGGNPWRELRQPSGFEARSDAQLVFESRSNRLLVVVGKNTGGNNVRTSAAYDLDEERWEILPETFLNGSAIPQMIPGCTVDAPGGAIRYGWEESTRDIVMMQLVGGVWSPICEGAACGADAPEASYGLRCVSDGAAAYQLFGVPVDEQRASNSVKRLDLAMRSWSRLPSAYLGRREFGVGILECDCADEGPRRFLIVGLGDTGPSTPSADGFEVIEINDDGTVGGWRRISHDRAPTRRETGGFFAASGNKVFVVGGHDGNGPLADAHRLEGCTFSGN